MSKYYRYFGLERDPFLDTADPFFYCELGTLRKAKERLAGSVDASRGLTVVLGEPGTGKTSLSGALEQDLLADDRVVLGKILDPTFAGDVEFLIAVGRVFGLALPPRSSAALKNALKNFSSRRRSWRSARWSSSSTKRRISATKISRRCACC